jgi:hypothetical protein
VQTILLWSDTAFLGSSPLAVVRGWPALLKPQIADLIRAAYDPVLPAAATDPAHALRLARGMPPAAVSRLDRPAKRPDGRPMTIHHHPVRVYYEDTDLAASSITPITCGFSNVAGPRWCARPGSASSR